MPFSRGDVVVVWFPHSDHQTFSRRPALVVQADGLVTQIPQTVTALITTNLGRHGHPSWVLIVRDTPGGQASGLFADSVVVTDNLATVRDEAIDRKIGALPTAEMQAIDAALRHTLGL